MRSEDLWGSVHKTFSGGRLGGQNSFPNDAKTLFIFFTFIPSQVGKEFSRIYMTCDIGTECIKEAHVSIRMSFMKTDI